MMESSGKFVVFIFYIIIVAVSGENGNVLPKRPECGLSKPVGQAEDGIARRNEFPWIARISSKIDGESMPLCGGVLINKRYVLTARTCCRDSTRMQIFLGEYDISQEDETDSPVVEMKVDKLIDYPKPTEGRYKHLVDNIALIRLSDDVVFTDSIQPICMPFSESDFQPSTKGDKVYVAGWGKTSDYRSAGDADKQRKIVFPIADRGECFESFKQHGHEITDNVFCAGNDREPDACVGFSGSPVMKESNGHWFVEGLVSYGIGCARREYPGVHTNVTGYEEWILNTIKLS